MEEGRREEGMERGREKEKERERGRGVDTHNHMTLKHRYGVINSILCCLQEKNDQKTIDKIWNLLAL